MTPDEHTWWSDLLPMTDTPKPRISILCPSRGRPAALREMYASALQFADGPIELVYRLDVGDPSARQYAPPRPSTKITGRRIVMSALWNDCWAAASGDIAMHCGDDIRFRTQSWDTAVVEAFEQIPDRIAFVHGRDGYQDNGLGTHGFLHRRWVETVGYFVPPLFSSDYNDLWLHEVAEAIGRRVFLPDVLTEHMHPAIGKGEWDRTHRERMVRHERDKPQDTWAATKAERARDAALLRAVIDAHAATLDA